MNKIVNGYDLRVGDRVRVVNATIGALGANDCIGTVISEIPKNAQPNGLREDMEIITLKLEKPTGVRKSAYWRVGAYGTYEVLSETKRKKHIEIDVIIKEDITKVIIDDKIGMAKRKKEDKFNEAYGIILAVASAYKLSAKTREALVDALYDDIKTLKEYDSLELLDELKNRVRE